MTGAGGRRGGGRAGAGGTRSGGRGGRRTEGSGSFEGQRRDLKVRVKTAKRRSTASARWLERQLNDPYVAEARLRGYRSRAAFKLLQLDDKYAFLKSGARVVDLGCAPGGWLQVVAERCGTKGRIIGIDLLAVEPVAGAEIVEGDFLAEGADEQLRALLGGPADLVLSDMAAPATGHNKTDHLRVMGLAEAALEFALTVLAPGGTFVAKVLQGGTERELLQRLKQAFASVRHVKPPASRSDSAEMYLVASGFRVR